MNKLDREVLEADFQEDLDMEKECFGRYNPAFKMRHFRKMLKKVEAGKPLSRREWCCSPNWEEDPEPMYDMDGGYYHEPEPTFSEYAEPEITAADWRR